MTKSGYVYLIQYPGGRYKIGRGKSATTRLKQLQRTSPARLYLLWSEWVKDMVAMERKLHKQYGTQKDKRGECFRLSEEDVNKIASQTHDTSLI